jgi:hypothetical protein
VRIALFGGNDKDTMLAEQWCEQVASCREISAWTEKQTAVAAIDCLRADAYTWKQNLLLGTGAEKAALENWTAFKALFLERFMDSKTATQQVKLVMELKQRPGELTKRFYDRVDNALKQVFSVRVEALQGDTKTGFVEARNAMTTLMFRAGMRQEVRLWVDATLTAAEPTLDQVKKAAMMADSALRAQQGVAGHAGGGRIAGIDIHGNYAEAASQAQYEIGAVASFSADSSSFGENKHVKQMKLELAALQSNIDKWNPGSSRGGGRGGRGGAGRGRGGAARPPSAGVAQIPIPQRGWIFCWNCSQWGQHMRHECRLSDSEVERLPKQDGKSKPQGNAMDSQFPN